VHPDHPVRTLGLPGDAGQRDRGCVAGQYRLRFADPVQGLKDLAFDLQVFARRLHHQIHIGHMIQIDDAFDVVQDSLFLLLGDFLFFQQAIEAGADAVDTAPQRLLGDVVKHDLKPRRGKHLRDTVAHGAGADDAYRFDLHIFLQILGSRY